MRKSASLFAGWLFAIAVASLEHAYSQTEKFPFRNAVRLVPVKAFDPVNPGLELQLERVLSSKFSVQLTGASLFDGLSTYYKSLHGTRVLLGGKYYFAHTSAANESTHFYTMLEGGLAYAVYRRNGLFVERNDTTNSYYEEEYRGVKQSYFYAARLGVQARTGRFSIDLSVGVGVKHRVVTHSERENPTHILTLAEPQMFAFTFGGLEENRSVWLNIPGALGVGYNFGKR